MPHRNFTNLVYLVQLLLLFRFQSAIGLATCRETGVEYQSEKGGGPRGKREVGMPSKAIQKDTFGHAIKLRYLVSLTGHYHKQ